MSRKSSVHQAANNHIHRSILNGAEEAQHNPTKDEKVVSCQQFDYMVRLRQQEELILQRLKQRKESMVQRKDAFFTESALQDCEIAILDSETAIAKMILDEQLCKVVDFVPGDSQSQESRLHSARSRQPTVTSRTQGEAKFTALVRQLEGLKSDVAVAASKSPASKQLASLKLTLEQISADNYLTLDKNQPTIIDELQAASLEHTKRITTLKHYKEELELQKEVAKLESELQQFKKPPSQMQQSSVGIGQQTQKAIKVRLTTPISPEVHQTLPKVTQSGPSTSIVKASDVPQSRKVGFTSQAQSKTLQSKTIANQSMSLHMDFIKLSTELLFPNSIVSTKVYLVSASLGTPDQWQEKPDYTLYCDRRHSGNDNEMVSLLFAEDSTVSIPQRFDGMIFLMTEITEGGGVSETLGWTLLNLADIAAQSSKSRYMLRSVEPPVNFQQTLPDFRKLKYLDDVCIYLHTYQEFEPLSTKFDASSIQKSDYFDYHMKSGLQDDTAQSKLLINKSGATSDPRASSVTNKSQQLAAAQSSTRLQSDRNKFKSMKDIVAKSPLTQEASKYLSTKDSQLSAQNLDKDIIFLARSLKTLAPQNVNLQVSFEKIHGIYDQCQKIRLQLSSLDDTDEMDSDLPDLKLKWNPQSSQLKEKADVKIDCVSLKQQKFLQFTLVDDSDEEICWGRVYLFHVVADGSLCLNTDVVDCTVFKCPAGVVDTQIENAGVWARVQEVDISGQALSAAQKLTQIPKEAWIPHRINFDLENMFEDQSGFALCVDGARFLLPNVMFSKVSAQLFDSQFSPIVHQPKLETMFDLDSDSIMPIYNTTVQYPVKIDRCSIFLLKINAIDTLSQKLKAFGFAMFNPFVDTLTLRQPEDLNNISRLNSGAFQLPIYQGRPDVTLPLDMKSLANYVQVPCATLLIRIVPLTELTNEFPLYHSEVYDSTRCTPSENEGQMYLQLLNERKTDTYKDQIQALRKHGVKGLGISDKEAIEWLNFMFTKPVKHKLLELWDYSQVVSYSPRHGLNISLDGSQNTGKKHALCLGVVSINPPGSLYIKDQVVMISPDNVRYTSEIESSSSIASPIYWDGYWNFRPTKSANCFAIFEVKAVDLSGDVTSVGWTAIHLFDQGGFATHGNYQLPLYHGAPLRNAVLELQTHEFPHYAMSEMLKRGQLRTMSGASVFARICDARRNEELKLNKYVDKRYLPATGRDRYQFAKSTATVDSLTPQSMTAAEYATLCVTKLKNNIYS